MRTQWFKEFCDLTKITKWWAANCIQTEEKAWASDHYVKYQVSSVNSRNFPLPQILTAPSSFIQDLLLYPSMDSRPDLNPQLLSPQHLICSWDLNTYS